MNSFAWRNDFARIRFAVTRVLLSLLWRTSRVVLFLVLLAFAVGTAQIDIALSVALAQEPTEETLASEPLDNHTWVTRIMAAEGDRYRWSRIVTELAELDPNRGLEILTIAWVSLTDYKTKVGMLRAFTQADHPRILDILNLGAEDASQPVRAMAFIYLRGYSIFDFSGDPDAYEQWWADFTNVPKEEVRQESARRAIEKLRNAEAADRDRLLDEFIHGDGNAEQVYKRLVSAGLLDLLENWLSDPTLENDNLGRLISPMREWPPPESYLRRVLLPLITADRDARERRIALSFLATPRHKWVVDFLLETLMSESDPEMVRHIGETLNRIEDPRAIPYLIGIIDADNSFTGSSDDTIYGVGYFCLSNLTGVDFSRFHDGPWWRRWWAKNKSTFPEEASSIPIPNLPKTEHGRDYIPYAEDMDTFEGISKYIVQAVAAPDPDKNLLNDLADELADRKEHRAIPLLIGVINATNSSETIYHMGQSSLGKLTDVQSSRFHDGPWWRRWWEENKSNFPEEVRAIPIPDLPKTAQARNYVPFPESLDTFEGVVAYISRMFEEGDPDMRMLGSFARELANREDPRAIPLLIGVIDADNSYTGGTDTVYGVGYFGLYYLTEVEYSRRHDGAWWRRWWEENKSTYPVEAQAISIPEFPKTAHGRTYVPFPEELDTAEGKSNAIRRMVEDLNPNMKMMTTLSEELVAQSKEHAIPLLIAVIALDNSYDTIYGIGYFALRHPTGVRYDETHDGDWWLDWWQQNKSSYSTEVQALEVPDFSPYAAEWKEKKEIAKTAAALADVADVSYEDRLAEEDENKRYFLIGANEGAEPPEGGYRLLVVMPGGAGGANFNPFVRRIFKNALSGKYLVAQVISKQWDEGQFDRLVWPTKNNPWPDMKFSTEEFVESVIREVTNAHTINPDHIYTLSWSSGGPAAYAVSLQENTAVKGSFVAMSIFKPDQLPPLEIAKNHAYYLLHSPQDFIPMAMPETARDRLGATGASVILQTYEGGHGWRGDVYGMIRSGITWLEEQAPSAAN